jgi:DNA polymerase IV
LSIAHIDCDAFYASIHKRDDKSLLNQPIIIGGGKRGVVSTACYIARSFGVRSAMPMFQASKLCPQAIIIKPNMALYSQVGKQVKNLMYEFTPIVHSVSIDEAYLDLSGTQRLHNALPCQSLAKLAIRIEKEIGISVSIGLSENRFLAKTASDMDKPRGFYALAKSDVKEVLWPKKIGFLHGIGPATVKKLEKYGLYTIEQLAKCDERQLFKEIGPNINRLKHLANGDDDRGFETETKRKSISTETTFFDDISDTDQLIEILKSLAKRIGYEARQKKVAGRTINLKLKTTKFQSITRQISLNEPTQTAKIMFEAIKPLLLNEINRAPFRLIGIGLSELEDEANADKGDLINQDAPKNLRLEKAIDTIINKYGKSILGTAKKDNSK